MFVTFLFWHEQDRSFFKIAINVCNQNVFFLTFKVNLVFQCVRLALSISLGIELFICTISREKKNVGVSQLEALIMNIATKREIAWAQDTPNK